jgi:hypothetical protein
MRKRNQLSKFTLSGLKETDYFLNGQKVSKVEYEGLLLKNERKN